MSLYDDLGVSKDATLSQIKTAFRRLAAKHHPDREGGNMEEFQKAQRAYAVLSDPAARQRYDETGTTQSAAQVDPEAVARRELIGIFLQVVEKGEVNYRLEVEREIAKHRVTCSAVIAANQTRTKRLKTALTKLARKKKKDDFLSEALKATISTLEQNIKQVEEQLGILKRMEELLAEGYGYNEVEAAPWYPASSFQSITGL